MKQALFMIICLFAIGCDKPQRMESVVLDKIYIPDTFTVGIGMTSNGGMTVVPAGKSAQYMIIFKDGDETIEANVYKEMFYSLNKGDRIYYLKGWSGIDFKGKVLN